MILLLILISHGFDYVHISKYIMGGNPRRYSEIMNIIVDHLYNNFFHKISGQSLSIYLPEKVHLFRKAIWNKLRRGACMVERMHNNILRSREYVFHDIPFETFRYFGFIDDTSLKMARPGDEPTRFYDFIHDIQRAFFSNYACGHGLKSQVIILPNGMIGSVFIAALRHNDQGMINMSVICNYLISLLQNIQLPPIGLLPSLYADGIFTPQPVISPRYRNPNEWETRFNCRMAGIRQYEEFFFADHQNLFKLFSMGWKLKLFRRGKYIRKLSLMSFFVLNCYYCLNNSRSNFFRLSSLSINEYLPLDENLIPPPVVNLGEVYDYHYPM